MSSAGLPAWKQAILERKRAKLAAGLELPPRGEGAPAARDAGGKKREGPKAAEGEGETAGERLVVAESLGPLRENPFMRLESERRRRRRRTSSPWAPEPPPPLPPPPPGPPPAPPPLSQLLELYGAMPGIRTIRADNILIIESQQRGPEGQAGGGASDDVTSPSPRPFWRRQQHQQQCQQQQQQLPPQDPFRALLARSGAPVTEIRASEVVVYEPRPPEKGEEQEEEEKGPPEAAPGMVSRLLQKFDQRRGPRGNRGRGGGVPVAAAAAVPKAAPSEEPCLPCVGPGARFVQKIGANSFTVNPRGRQQHHQQQQHRPPGPPASAALSNGPLEPQEGEKPPPASQQEEEDPHPQPVPSSPSPAAPPPSQAGPWKPKPRKGPAADSASPDSSATHTLARNGAAFEIRPAPKPDLAAIPAHDLQAQALASLRLNSRNSFLFVPRRKEPAAPVPERQAETPVPVTCIDEDLLLLEPEPGSLPPLRVLSPRLEGFDVPHEGNLDMEEAAVASLCSPGPFPPKNNGNTFTIVPKRRPPAPGLETFHRAWLPEPEEEEEEEAKARAPHLELGHLLKKRYPTVHEIQVIGGYLSLDKSCMSKSGSRRKKGQDLLLRLPVPHPANFDTFLAQMKISFNESSLQTMFEYPSESSLVEEEEEEEEEEEYATEVDEALPALFIPRPTCTRHPNTTNSGLSSYTPKHSLEFGKWQEKQQEGAPPSPGAFPQDADRPGLQDMLTPADTDSLSDFSSEPALYF